MHSKKAWLVLIAFLFSGCTHSTTNSKETLSELPSRLATISDFLFEGAFALPDSEYGQSSANWAEGVIEVNGSSMFFVGHDHDNAIAEFSIPALRNTTRLTELNYAETPRQAFTRPLDRAIGGNPEQLDQIVGLELYKGRLVGNAIEYYDAPGDNRQSTFVIDDAAAISASPVSGFYSLRGKTRASGWLSSVPPEWRQALGCTHITGHSSGGPIISRHSVGPSAFCINLDQLTTESRKRTVKTSELLGFSLSRPLATDLFNEFRENHLWTHLSEARYGFIIPGTSTYATFGTSGGHKSGVGYKIEHSGEPCAGYCPADPADNYNYYWFWDARDLLKVKAGRMPASSVRPYASGKFDIPFQSAGKLNAIGGASYDEQSGLLYISVLKANNSLGQYSNPPVIVAYRISR
ncbi:hypothetical protein AB833_20635 [Chromatiales bacterium (ex Bugula neritina AB1)]|nr:hypothetical protein AB833_20635 [Chromatiales bacterium (ex Bugula neritina AB1)]